MFGEMLRAPEIDVPTITAQYCKFNYIADKDNMEHRMDPQQRHEVQDRAVQHGAFRGRDGTIATFFVNVSESSVSFEVDLSAYGAQGETFDVERITGGRHEDWLVDVSLPRRERIHMEPLSITVTIVKAHL